MPPAPDLSCMSHAEKDALILRLLPLSGQLEAALARIAVLEAQVAALTRPPKTPDNSSTPPSQQPKPNRPVSKHPNRRRGRPGSGRALHEAPDRVVEAHLSSCPHCEAAFPVAEQRRQEVYDRIELPPIKPDVTRVHLFGGRCACCGLRATAPAPAGLAPGSPFGRSIEALVVYLHYAQAISIERLRLVLGEIFNLSISEGALCNILARAQAPLSAAADRIAAAVRASPVVCSDETSARVMGKNWWEWVFIGQAGVLHVIRPSRGSKVPQEIFGDVRPKFWVSDAYSAQRNHAERWQMCLAHLLRDTQYVVECGDTGFGPLLKRLLLRAMVIDRRKPDLKDTTLAQYRADLDRRLDRIMAAIPIGPEGVKLRHRIARHRAYLFEFTTNRDVPATNNISERHLRPSVIFRKVTNGFRSQWGAATYAAFRSVVSTAKRAGNAVLNEIRNALVDEGKYEPG